MSETDELLEIALLHGSESNVAERVETLRKQRGWSQEQLAKRLTAAGRSMPQSAISRIEKPPPGGRRAVTVDEVLALARAFKVGLLDILLPPEALAERELLKDLRTAPEYLAAAFAARAEYDGAVDRVTAELRTNSHWRRNLQEGLRTVRESLAEIDEDHQARPRLEVRAEFLKTVLDATETTSEES